jgi:filamentous hemagglutinin family protein
MFRRLVAVVIMFNIAGNVMANPTGMTVAGGSATTTVNGSQLTITTSRNASLNWQSFNIAAGETTIFQQPSSTSIVWNRINDQNPSQIYGSLQANGIVVLLNNSGFYFGPNSFVSAAGLVVSTANCIPPQNSGGGWEFNGPPPLASIVNYGQINIGRGGSAFLIADQIENHGSIKAPGGTVGLAAGQTVLLSDRPDGRGMSMQVTLPSGSVDNEGKLIADGGTIALNARVVNQNGFIQADSVKNHNGVIELVASDQLTLGADSQIAAKGDNSPAASAGGDVTLKSENNFSDAAGSQIDVSGGSHGGNGGRVEISAPSILSLNSAINAGAQSGWKKGVFSLDPLDIVLGTISDTSDPGVLYVDVNHEFQNINANIELDASGNIYVGNGLVTGGTFVPNLNGGIIWDLYTSTGYKTDGLLTLLAGGNITFVDGSLITYSADHIINTWAVTLKAGYDFVNNSVQPGNGSIFLGDVVRDSSGTPVLVNGNLVPASGSGSIETFAGTIDLTAGQDIQVGSGFVRTTGGGAVSAWALKGDVNTGTYDYGYSYNSSASGDPYYVIDNKGVGGISTSGGGNVKITAGGNVTSFLPSGNDSSDAGTGTFAEQDSGLTGDVTIIAGGNVTGHYAVANGTGTIYAGVQMDKNGNPVTDASGNYVLNPVYTGTDPASTGNAGTANNKLALSLISGGWTVDAANNIFLQEVRNPNGFFNNVGSAVSSKAYHKFDYASDAYVNLNAGNSVTLGTGLGANASDPPRVDDMPFIYAPILNIVAGAGGVELTGTYSSQLTKLGELILFPSPQGSLTITTTGDSTTGDLTGQYQAQDASLDIYDLIVSDSGYQKYYSFAPGADVFGANDHAQTPIHSTSPTLIALNISGNMNDVLLSAPEAAQITVGGDMINSRFQGMNLSSDPSESDVVTVREADGSLGTATVRPGVTSIYVTGDILNRSTFTTIDLPSGSQAPDLSMLSQLFVDNNNPLPAGLSGLTAATLAASFFYDKTTGKLTYQNIVLNGASVDIGTLMGLLQNMTIQSYKDGVPQYNSDGTPVLTHNVSVLDVATATALAGTYTQLGVVPYDTGSGYFLGGGGQFNVNAHNIDLGTSGGIQTLGASYDTYYFLDKNYRSISDANGQPKKSYPLIAAGAASILVTVSGNLDMFSTMIASLYGGNIYINAGGNINVGSPVFSANTTDPRGIFSTDQGNVAVYADGNIEVNGSRIAVYDTRQTSDNSSGTLGGSVTVVSRNGNIDAGNGGSGFVDFYSYRAGPDQTVASFHSEIPGSGIMDVSYTQPGSILVESPNGSVNAGAGGILQLLLNGPPLPESTTLFSLPVNQKALANMFNWALTGKMKAALALQKVLNGNPGNSAVDVFAGYELQQLAYSLTPEEILAGDTLQNLPSGLQAVLDKNGNQIELATSLTPAEIQAGDTLQSIPAGLQFVVDKYVNPFVNALNLSDGTLVRTSNNQDITATGSGVIAAGAITMKASGDITGNIFTEGDANVASDHTINVDLVAGGKVDATAPSLGDSQIIGLQGVDATGDTSGASLFSNDQVSGGQNSMEQGTAADVASQGMASENSATPAKDETTATDDDDKKKKGKAVAMIQKKGRVTVLLPPKHLSQNQTSSSHL